jgi:lipopolysaccharide/colanic/teichoic acid biosynthesis glycosyltransferase
MRKKAAPSQRAYDTIYWIGKEKTPLFLSLAEQQYTLKQFSDPFLAYVHCLSLSYANGSHPYCILVDENSLGSDAYTFIGNIRSCNPLRALPCLLINEQETRLNLRAAKQLGADDYYTGSFCFSDLLDRIGFLAETKQVELPVGSPVLPPVKISFWKRAFDIFFAGSVLLALSPILLLIALLIKLDSPGPIFYISKRVGTGYRIFNFYKFRSMRQDADKLMEKYMHLNQYQGNGKSAFVKIANDPRVTRLGRFLRNSSLDELPQLFNVLLGHMSIVGNRPLPLYEAELITRDLWSKRFMAPAGITGLWQVTKRGQKDMSEEERIHLDMTYADKNSIWYDMKIMARTIPALMQKESV